MIEIIKNNENKGLEEIDKSYNCNSCLLMSDTLYEIRVKVRNGIGQVTYLCPRCAKELTYRLNKELEKGE